MEDLLNVSARFMYWSVRLLLVFAFADEVGL